MTSEERREKRYQNRKRKRELRKQKRCDDLGSLDEIFSYSNLYKAGKKCCNHVRWKTSVQQFENRLFSGTAVRRRQILDGKWNQGKYTHFTLSERGKTRPIDAPRIQDRQVHKVFTKNVLLPLYLPDMIYNNCASLEGKGLHFSLRLLKNDLQYHFRRYGREGHVILIDFSQFFPSASHEVIYERHKRLLLNKDLQRLGAKIVSANGNRIGMPLGVEPSQAEMIAYPSPLDNFIKCQLSMKCAGHYMDDYYVIVPPTMDVKAIFRQICDKAESIGLHINYKKTHIIPIAKPFRYCKAKFTLTETGRVIVNGSRDSIKRARRKIKMFKRKIDSGEITYIDLWEVMNSAFAYYGQYNDHGRILRLRRLFYALFGFSAEHYENFKIKELARKGVI